MKKFNTVLAILMLSVFTLVQCRETKEEKAEDAIEEVGEDIEDAGEEVGEEMEDAANDVKEEMDGETDDN